MNIFFAILNYAYLLFSQIIFLVLAIFLIRLGISVKNHYQQRDQDQAVATDINDQPEPLAIPNRFAKYRKAAEIRLIKETQETKTVIRKPAFKFQLPVKLFYWSLWLLSFYLIFYQVIMPFLSLLLGGGSSQSTGSSY